MSTQTKTSVGFKPRLNEFLTGIEGIQGLPFILGTWYFVDPYSGASTNTGKHPGNAFASIVTAYAACTSGAGDGICLISRGTGTASQTTSYITLANTITWSKHGITVIGICSGSFYNQRARIANSGTDVINPINLTGSNNHFENVSFVNGHVGGGGEQSAALKISGGAARNAFVNCDFKNVQGTADAYKCDLWLSNAHENTFKDCNFGSASFDAGNNASCHIYIDGASGNAQNLFDHCTTIAQVSTGTAFGVLKGGAVTALNGTNIFRDCLFNVWQANTGLTAMTSWYIGSNLTTGNIFIFCCGSNGYAAWDSAGANDNVVVCNLNGATAEIAAAGIGVLAS